MNVKDLDHFEKCLTSLYNPKQLESFWLCRPCFDKLLRSNFLSEWLSKLLKQCQYSEPSALVALRDDLAGIEFSNGIKLDITLLDPNSSSVPISSVLGHTMLGFAAGKHGTLASVELFLFPESYDSRVFNPTTPLQMDYVSHVELYDIIEVDPHKMLHKVTNVNSPIVLLTMKSRDLIDISWQYDANSLLPISAISTNMSVDRLYFCTKLLGNLPNPASLNNLKKIITHPSHRVRWAAMQAMFKLDFSTGIEYLSAAVNDEHPSIRNAARKYLNHIKKSSQ